MTVCLLFIFLVNFEVKIKINTYKLLANELKEGVQTHYTNLKNQIFGQNTPVASNKLKDIIKKEARAHWIEIKSKSKNLSN